MPEPDALALLSEDLRAAFQREELRGAPPGAVEDFTRFVRRHLESFLADRAVFDRYRLSLGLLTLTHETAPGEVAERETARQWLAPEARRRMMAANLAAPGREIAYVLTPGPDGTYDHPHLCFRGHATGTMVRRGDCGHPRALHIHVHPSGVLEPSDTDLRTVDLGSEQEHGWGITDPSVSRLYLIREPGPPRLAGEVGPPPLASALLAPGHLAPEMPLMPEAAVMHRQDAPPLTRSRSMG